MKLAPVLPLFVLLAALAAGCVLIVPGEVPYMMPAPSATPTAAAATAK
jgi:hypothetical protein